jgi:pimeloyl-ACP methyl ester carboxylesterase
VTGAAERHVDLPAGTFRVLEWPGDEPAAVLLHGLTAVAEVWGPTVSRMVGTHPRCLAPDQRGHGHSPKPASGYAIGSYVRDVLAMVEALGLDRPHLVGHSMGARVAIVAAARHPGRFRSVAIVDIGPEQWTENWKSTIEGLERVPQSWPDAESAIETSVRPRQVDGTESAAPDPAELRAIALARLRQNDDGSVTWLADREALKQAVRSQRSRNFWKEWEQIAIPTLLVRGGRSREVRQHIADEMRRRKPGVRYEEIPGTGHNVPLLTPGRLAALLQDFWLD